ncbi:MAG: LLM class F420-dependent oxidoreductase, partial [Chloroflexota bacterium]|nr:LLM class F420-dependent oxidoreductase [Chloroflexota bacterium]
MDIGIALLMTRHDFNTTDLARKVEEFGFESLWAPEHGIVPIDFKVAPATGRQGGIPKFYAEGGINQIIDPLLFLAAAATITKKIKLGTGICLVPERNPIRLAKEVATLDHISNGRFLFGIGAGWLKGESEILGVDFPHRWKQTREYLDVMQKLWTTEITEYHGEYVDFPPLVCDPKPVQKPHPPIFVGGELEAAARRIANYGDGWLPRARNTSQYQDPDKLSGARKHIEELMTARGRDASKLNIT